MSSSRKLLTPLSQLPNFDPRTVPMVGADTWLPAVAPASLSPAALRQRFLAPPVWHPEVLAEKRFTEREPVAASVLIPIVLRERPTVLLTQRTAHMTSHSGQIAFPGGKRDPADVDLQATALREAYEEVGLRPEFVHVLGNLPVYVTGSAFVITPVVGLITDGFSLVRNVDEVEAMFEVPLDFLMNPSNHHQHVFEWEGARREWLSMPFQDGETERFIWGATAGMLRNLYRLLIA